MSAETKQALDEAIAAHIADETGGGKIITGYNLVAANIDADSLERGSTNYFHEYGQQRPFHVCIGLAAIAKMRLHEDWADDDD